MMLYYLFWDNKSWGGLDQQNKKIGW